jgi:hypothetical protein
VAVAGPQAAKIMLVKTTRDMIKYIERFTISLLSKYGRTNGWVWGE